MKTGLRRIVKMCGASATAMVLIAFEPGYSAATTSTDFQSLTNSNALVIGPVERVDASKFLIEVLGQEAALPPSQRSIKIGELIGKMVAVYGSVNSDGRLIVADVIELDSVRYVPGATRLYLKGKVISVDRSTAEVRIGSLTVRYSDALHTLNPDDLKVNHIASFSGQRFSNDDDFYSDEGVARNGSDLSKPLSQEGSDVAKPLSQEGSDVAKPLSQEGSDVARPLSQEGSDVARPLSQEGSDVAKPLSQEGSD